MCPLAHILAKQIVFTLKDAVQKDEDEKVLDSTVLSVLGKWIDEEELRKQSKTNDDENEKSNEDQNKDTDKDKEADNPEGAKEAQDEEAKQALSLFQDLQRKCSWAGELPKEVSSHPLYIALQAFEVSAGQGRDFLDSISKYSIVRLEETLGGRGFERPFQVLHRFMQCQSNPPKIET